MDILIRQIKSIKGAKHVSYEETNGEVHLKIKLLSKKYLLYCFKGIIEVLKSNHIVPESMYSENNNIVIRNILTDRKAIIKEIVQLSSDELDFYDMVKLAGFDNAELKEYYINFKENYKNYERSKI